MNLYTLTKPQLLTYGRGWVEAFTKTNQIHPVKEVVAEAPPERFVGRGPYASARLTGLYIKGTIWVNLARCAVPAQGRVSSWSFPGNKTDRTAMGVLAHEFGHHVDETLGLPSRTATWKALKTSYPITSYEPVPSEAFAETMRLFITNSNLLMQGSPQRYSFLVNELGLWPVVFQPYLEVLKERGASEAIMKAASRWAGQDFMPGCMHRR